MAGILDALMMGNGMATNPNNMLTNAVNGGVQQGPLAPPSQQPLQVTPVQVANGPKAPQGDNVLSAARAVNEIQGGKQKILDKIKADVDNEKLSKALAEMSKIKQQTGREMSPPEMLQFLYQKGIPKDLAYSAVDNFSKLQQRAETQRLAAMNADTSRLKAEGDIAFNNRVADNNAAKIAGANSVNKMNANTNLFKATTAAQKQEFEQQAAKDRDALAAKSQAEQSKLISTLQDQVEAGKATPYQEYLLAQIVSGNKFTPYRPPNVSGTGSGSTSGNNPLTPAQQISATGKRAAILKDYSDGKKEMPQGELDALNSYNRLLGLPEKKQVEHEKWGPNDYRLVDVVEGTQEGNGQPPGNGNQSADELLKRLKAKYPKHNPPKQ